MVVLNFISIVATGMHFDHHVLYFTFAIEYLSYIINSKILIFMIALSTISEQRSVFSENDQDGKPMIFMRTTALTLGPQLRGGNKSHCSLPHDWNEDGLERLYLLYDEAMILKYPSLHPAKVLMVLVTHVVDPKCTLNEKLRLRKRKMRK